MTPEVNMAYRPETYPLKVQVGSAWDGGPLYIKIDGPTSLWVVVDDSIFEEAVLESVYEFIHEDPKQCTALRYFEWRTEGSEWLNAYQMI